MSVLIRGMKMPENCARCRCARGCPAINDRMVRMDKHPWFPRDYRHEDCPLVPVPPHGRLIDADAVIDDIRGEILEHQMNGMKGTPFYIEDLRLMWQRLEDEELVPTVIPAEHEEEKMK